MMFSQVSKMIGVHGTRALHSSRPVQGRVYDSILDTIGETPIVKVNNIGPPDVNIYAKCEFFNPLSSVKDRLALAVIEAAEKSGELKPGQTVVEATSGNTGIALAMVCAAKGYPLVITMAETFSVERRKIMRFLGAKVVLTAAAGKGTGMVEKARELADKNGWFMTRQFENAANADFHAKTTGAEVLSCFGKESLDYFVTGYGTGGTLLGAARTIKAASPDTKVILSEPSVAPLISSGVAQERKSDGSPAASHPSFTPHPVQGWTPDFIPLLGEQAVEKNLFDELLPIDPKEAIATSQLLAQKEGIFTGVSGGATMGVALKVAKEHAKPGDNIVAMIPDTAERYLSTPLFADIAADMDEEEAAISKSTPSFHLAE